VNLVDPDGQSWFFNSETGDFFYHLEDDDDKIYMITKEQYDKGTESDDLKSYLQTVKGDDNLFGYIFDTYLIPMMLT